MVSTIKKLAKFFVGVTYKYDVDSQVLNNIIAHNNEKKVINNNQ